MKIKSNHSVEQLSCRPGPNRAVVKVKGILSGLKLDLPDFRLELILQKPLSGLYLCCWVLELSHQSSVSRCRSGFAVLKCVQPEDTKRVAINVTIFLVLALSITCLSHASALLASLAAS